ncbi:MAG: hypothetical protein V4625_07725 [Pseudomonadota bacterium]
MLDAVHWAHSVRDWLDALGRGPARPGKPPRAASFENIRQAMLDTVARAESGGRAAPRTRLTYRIMVARDIEALWFLRSDVMQLLSANTGELQALAELNAINARFKGLLPVGLGPRRHVRQNEERKLTAND